MIQNKTSQETQKEYEAVQKEIAALQNKQVRLKLLQEVQRQHVTRPYWTWFVAGNAR